MGRAERLFLRKGKEMTNEQIIWAQRVKLRDEGILQNTGRMVPVESENGGKSFVAEPEQIHTFGEWKRRGYTVRHGEKAVSSFPIWRMTKKRSEEGTDPAMVMKTAFFFKASQVDKDSEVQKGA